MKNYNLLFLIVIVLFSINTILEAQEDLQFVDKLYLNNGSVIYSALVNLSDEGDIRMIIVNGNEIFIPNNRIKKIVTNKRKFKKRLANEIQKSGFIHTLDMAFLSPNSNGRNDIYIGTAINYSLSYRFDGKVGVGIGSGWETYSLGANEHFIPIKLDFIGYLVDRYRSPFVRFQMGHSFFVTSDDRLKRSKGGWMLNPAFGWRLDGNHDLNYFIEFGYKMQKANIVVECLDDDCFVLLREQDLLFRRFNFKFGVNF